MIALAVIVFAALHRIEAAYGMTYSPKWGPSLNNKVAWVLMEAPVFVAMVLLWIFSPRSSSPSVCVMASFFLLHYFQRSFVFPLLMRGKSRMPAAIMLMGITFNLVNAYLIGGWLFYVSPEGMYDTSWFSSPLFILGTVIFFFGMFVNIQSDSIIRHLRKPGDRNHYIPRGGMYNYVACGNYFGEVVEWLGYAVLTWSLAGFTFFLWTFANLAPRARTIHRRYVKEFGEDYEKLNLHYILPFIY